MSNKQFFSIQLTLILVLPTIMVRLFSMSCYRVKPPNDTGQIYVYTFILVYVTFLPSAIVLNFISLPGSSSYIAMLQWDLFVLIYLLNLFSCLP